jgi:hypothetical protein
MSATTPTNQSHSADVRMELRINGRILPIDQLGPSFIILETTADYPPTEAEITLCIDGHERRWPIWLTDGISAEQRRTRITRCATTSRAAG